MNRPSRTWRGSRLGPWPGLVIAMIAVPAVVVVVLVLALTAGGSSEPESTATPPG